MDRPFKLIEDGETDPIHGLVVIRDNYVFCY